MVLRSIVIKEDNRIIYKQEEITDKNIEYDIFKFLKFLNDEKNIINIIKLFNIISGYYNITPLRNSIDIFKNNKNWKF